MKLKFKAILKILLAKRFILFSVLNERSVDIDSTDMKYKDFITIHQHNRTVLLDAMEQEDAVNTAQQIINSDLW